MGPNGFARQERKTRNESDLIINDGDAIDDDPGNQKSFFLIVDSEPFMGVLQHLINQ